MQKIVRRAALGMGLLLTSAVLSAQTPNDGGDKTAVRLVVETYLRGLKFNDTTSLRDAFWPDARLFYIKRDGSLGQLTQQAWYATFAGSVGKEEEGSLKITAIDVTRDIASVKVVEEYPRSRYTDYLSLVRMQGKWKIVNKIYTAEQK